MTSHLHFPKLKYSPLKNLIAIREEAKKELDEILKTHEGDKTIVLDPALTRPVSYENVATSSFNFFHRIVRLTHTYTHTTAKHDNCGYSSI